MKVVLCLVWILLAADVEGGFWDDQYDCFEKCHLIPHHKMQRICAESGKTYIDRCYLDCFIQYPRDRNGRIPDGDLKEVDCKPGTVDYCWNAECTEQEKTFLGYPITPLCDKDPPYDDTRLPCSFKCMKEVYDKKEVELIPCSEVKKEEKSVST